MPRYLLVAFLAAGCGGDSDTTDTTSDTSSPTTSTEPLPEGVTLVDLELTTGNVVFEIHEDWAPLGVARFLELVEAGFYDDTRFFRVVPDFVVQFGLNGDPEVNTLWRNQPILDDPPNQSNDRRTIAFASAGAGTRTTQLFVNLADNTFLDADFPPIGRVVEGMPNIVAINAEYGEQPDQMRISLEGNAYLDAAFPRLDGIITARVRE